MFNWNLWFQYLFRDFNTYTHRDIYIVTKECLHVCVYMYVLPGSVNQKNPQAKTPQQQLAHLASRSWFLNIISKYHYPIKRTWEGKVDWKA